MHRRAITATVLITAFGLAIGGAALPAAADIVDAPIEDWVDAEAFSMAPIGTHESGIFNEGASEIVAYHGASQRMFVINADAAVVEVLDISDPADPTLLFTIETESLVPGGTANSVAVRADGLAAVAVEAATKTDPGSVVFFDAAGTGELLGSVTVGALPDMLTFTPDGSRVVVANEGEPDDDYLVDPDGSVSIIPVPATVTAPAGGVQTAVFTGFNAAPPAGVRVFGIPGTTLSQSVEPEYITVSPDSTTAYVTLQEANAIATVELATSTVTDLAPLGVKDWSQSALDASNNDLVEIKPFPVFGMYQPDAIGSVGGYLVTANEGDVREWGDYDEATAIEDVELCDGLLEGFLGEPGYPATVEQFQGDAGFGPLKITTTLGDTGECYDSLYAFGARSFSVWTTSGELVFDSGDDFEQLTAALVPDFFNSNHEESNFDNRSDDKGPEPEGLAIGEVDGVPYAFIGFERVGGVAVYRLADPTAPEYAGYINNRDFAVDGEDTLEGAGDLGPEGLAFISAAQSPTGAPLLAVGNEVSGSTTIYSITTPHPQAVLPNTGTAQVDGTTWLIVAGALVLAGAAAVRLRRGAV